MSIIHKALKKAEGEERMVGQPPADPEDIMLGGGGGGPGPGGLMRRLPPLRLILLAVLVLSAGFAVYRFLFAPKPEPATLATPLIPPGLTGAPGEQSAAVPGRRPTHPENEGLPEAIVELVEDGEAFFEAAQYDAALERFQAATEKEPELAMLWNNIGLIHRKLGNLDKATEAYDKALILDPKYAAAMNNLGMVKLAAGDRLAAALYFRKSTTIDPTYADAHFNLAVLMEEEGNWQSAVEEYKQFLANTKLTDEALLEQVRLRVEDIAP